MPSSVKCRRLTPFEKSGRFLEQAHASMCAEKTEVASPITTAPAEIHGASDVVPQFFFHEGSSRPPETRRMCVAGNI